MPITSPEAGTRIDEIAASIYRISTPVPPNAALPAGFTFNQFLIVDDEPLLFHTGMRRIFPLVRDAVASVMPVEKLRWISFSHLEADESGSLVEWLAAAPGAAPPCGRRPAAGDRERHRRSERGDARGHGLLLDPPGRRRADRAPRRKRAGAARLHARVVVPGRWRGRPSLAREDPVGSGRDRTMNPAAMRLFTFAPAWGLPTAGPFGLQVRRGAGAGPPGRAAPAPRTSSRA